MSLAVFRPQPLARIPDPFNDPEWIFELKLDGFRALAYVENGGCRLISRNGHTFRRFDPLCGALAQELKIKNAILDGEIVCLDEEGRSLFNSLLFRKRTPIFAAFDLLWVDGEDLRERPLIERKKRLRRAIPQHDPQHPHLLHVDFLGGQVKTGQLWTSENRPPRAGDRDGAVLSHAGLTAQAVVPRPPLLMVH